MGRWVINWSSGRIHKEIHKNMNEIILHTYDDEWQYCERSLEIWQEYLILAKVERDEIINLIKSIATLSISYPSIICPHLPDQKKKEGFLHVNFQGSWNYFYVVIQGDACSWYSVDSGGIVNRIPVKDSAVVLIKAEVKGKKNVFAILVADSKYSHVTYFLSTPSQSEQLEWIHVCLQQGSHFLEDYTSINPITIISLRHPTGLKLALDVITNKLITVQKDFTLFWMEHHGPEEVYLMASTRGGEKYLSVQPNGQIFASHSKKDETCLLREIKHQCEAISLRTIYGTFFTLNHLNECVEATSTVLGSDQIFTKHYPNMIVSIKVNYNTNFMTTSIEGDLSFTKSIPKRQEQFEMRHLLDSMVTFKSRITGNLISAKPNMTVMANKSSIGKVTSAERWRLERRENGTTRIRSMADNSFLSVHLNQVYLSKEPTEFVILLP
eukprot:TRINITY_DN12769_c0_g1_i1.p1 TRINITY_DN12769_c0_g1~~TRINITY_DN12769_c0_g1_i1.p1  ORF type:complete len:439 (-),score=103.22 TRINITY_DN12769_c0_g1_i1:72-1388(-)